MATQTTIAGRAGGSALSQFAQKLKNAYVIRRRRAAFARLAHLEQHILDDIGLTRADIEWGMRLPLEQNAAVVVRDRRLAARKAR